MDKKSTTWNDTVSGYGVLSAKTNDSLPWADDLPYTVATIFLSVMIVIFHSFGLYLLFNVKKTRSNNMVGYSNKKLLILLSSTELSNGLFSITWLLFMKVPLVLVISGLLMLIGGGLSLSAIYLMTLNRLLSTVYPLWYIRSMSKKKFVVLVVLVCFVVTGLSIGCNIVVYGYRNIKIPGITTSSFIICRIIVHLLFNLYLIFCVFTYVAILIKILNSRRDSQTNDDNDANSTTTFQYVFNFLKTQGYTAPFIITLTHIILVDIPTVVFTVCVIKECSAEDSVHKFWGITYSINSLSDAFIYVLFDPDIRKYLKIIITERRTHDDSHTASAIAVETAF